MFEKPLRWLQKSWWGLLIAYILIIVTTYLAIWQFAEPLGIPDSIDNFPYFVKTRVFLHLSLTLLIAAHITLILDLVIRYRNESLATSVPKISKTKFFKVPLDQIANSDMLENYSAPPFSKEDYGGVKFSIKPKRGIFDSAALRPGKNSATIELENPIEDVHSLYLLTNAGGGIKEYEEEIIGRIQLKFDEDVLEKELILGQNIREWAIGNPFDLVDKAKDPSLQHVWEGLNTDKNQAVIDRLEIPILQPYRQKKLKQIVISREAKPNTLQFLIFAITLEYT